MTETSLVPYNGSAEEMESMNRIARQIEEFQKLKDEAQEDLESLMDEYEQSANLPDNFDQVVELAIEEEKIAQEESFERTDEMKALENEVVDDEGRQFWQRFLKADYLEQDNSENPTHAKVQMILADPEKKKEYEKRQKEMKKIQNLDHKIAQANKPYREMKQGALKRKRDNQIRLEMELEKQENRRKRNYLRSGTERSKKGSRSRQGSRKSARSKKSTNTRKSAHFDVPFSGKHSKKSSLNSSLRSKKSSRQEPQKEDDTSTFLTGVGKVPQNQALHKDRIQLNSI